MATSATPVKKPVVIFYSSYPLTLCLIHQKIMVAIILKHMQNLTTSHPLAFYHTCLKLKIHAMSYLDYFCISLASLPVAAHAALPGGFQPNCHSDPFERQVRSWSHSAQNATMPAYVSKNKANFLKMASKYIHSLLPPLP